ncbi:hypothetical protein IF1G_07993 [Cordyceps javanica]|uniref:Uncharacterized protein n=1 Tax=Cordyceps javanica TaxID=43265 RepID=A0A545UVC5_9HYPO|nr:hypothetical protein IF1G_07993 [Cordyceps javanica]
MRTDAESLKEENTQFLCFIDLAGYARIEVAAIGTNLVTSSSRPPEAPPPW